MEKVKGSRITKDLVRLLVTCRAAGKMTKKN